MRLAVFKPGTQVTVGNIEAIVTAVTISAECHVTYECVWWDGSERYQEWVEAFEVRPSDKTREIDIGFKVV